MGPKPLREHSLIWCVMSNEEDPTTTTKLDAADELGGGLFVPKSAASERHVFAVPAPVVKKKSKLGLEALASEKRQARVAHLQESDETPSSGTATDTATRTLNAPSSRNYRRRFDDTPSNPGVPGEYRERREQRRREERTTRGRYYDDERGRGQGRERERRRHNDDRRRNDRSHHRSSSSSSGGGGGSNSRRHERSSSTSRKRS